MQRPCEQMVFICFISSKRVVSIEIIMHNIKSHFFPNESTQNNCISCFVLIFFFLKCFIEEIIFADSKCVTKTKTTKHNKSVN